MGKRPSHLQAFQCLVSVSLFDSIHNLLTLPSQVVLGTVFLWFGWLGFNGGSCFAGSIKAALALFNTNLAGSTGAITWLLMDFRLERKWSVVGFCTGAIAGLVSHLAPHTTKLHRLTG